MKGHEKYLGTPWNTIDLFSKYVIPFIGLGGVWPQIERLTDSETDIDRARDAYNRLKKNVLKCEIRSFSKKVNTYIHTYMRTHVRTYVRTYVYT